MSEHDTAAPAGGAPVDPATAPPEATTPAATEPPAAPPAPAATAPAPELAPAAPAPFAAAPSAAVDESARGGSAAAPQFGGGAPIVQSTDLAKSTDPGYVSAKPLLTTGAYGTIVEELANLLDAAGYPNKVAAGLAPPMLDDELMRIVRLYQEERGINPAAMQGDAAPLIRRDHEGIVETATWAALHGHDSYEDAGQNAELVVELRYPIGALS